jgi:phosphohistidine phosphatase SixA
VLVGHDPAFSALVATLTGLHWFAVAKGTLVRIDADRPLRSGEGLLRWVVPPDLLKAERPER